VRSPYVITVGWAKENVVYRRRMLFVIRKRLGIASVRKNTSTSAERSQALLDIKAHDRAGKWGVDQVRQRLANEGTFISRHAPLQPSKRTY
jgi:hypothetical protein